MHYAYALCVSLLDMVTAYWMLLNADLQVYVPGFNDPEAPFFKTPGSTDPGIAGGLTVISWTCFFGRVGKECSKGMLRFRHSATHEPF